MIWNWDDVSTEDLATELANTQEWVAYRKTKPGFSKGVTEVLERKIQDMEVEIKKRLG